MYTYFDAILTDSRIIPRLMVSGFWVVISDFEDVELFETMCNVIDPTLFGKGY